VAVGVGIILVLVYFLRNILVGFALAAAVAYILTPLVEQIRRRSGMSRGMVAVGIYLCAVAITVGAGWWGGRKAYGFIGQFSSDPQQHVHHLVARLMGSEDATLLGIHLDATDLTNRIFTAARNNKDQAALVFNVVLSTVLFFVLLFYFLLQGPTLGTGLLNLAPPEHRPFVRNFVRQADPILSRYLRGLFFIVLITSFLTWIGIGLVFHLPYAVLLSVATGVLELLPVIGPTVSAFLLGGVAVMHGGTIWTLLGFAGFCFAVRMCIDQIIGPIILGRAVTLPPVVVIFGFLAGGALFGILGMLVAIPVLALLKIVLDDYYALPVE
jgi:predicted PurR-regulated permease PerM